MNTKKIIIVVIVAVLAVVLVTTAAFVFLIIPTSTTTQTQPTPSTSGTALTISDAATLAQNYVTQLGNSNLSVKEVDDYSKCFYVMVVEKTTGAGAFELTINNKTGAIIAEQGAMMLWNTKYGINSKGMMGYLTTGTGGGMMGSGGMMTWLRGTPTLTMATSMEQAGTIAKQYLNANYTGTSVGQVTTFYGYYNMQVIKDGKIYGMMTVDGHTGQVLYCSWLGTFIQRMLIG